MLAGRAVSSPLAVRSQGVTKLRVYQLLELGHAFI
jgi:hypothetical protein